MTISLGTTYLTFKMETIQDGVFRDIVAVGGQVQRLC